MSQQKYITAAGFLVLAGRVRDAITLCYRQMNDFQLALVVCRLLEGNNEGQQGNKSDLYRVIIEDNLINNARLVGDRWLLHIGYWLLDKQRQSVDVMINDDTTITTTA